MKRYAVLDEDSIVENVIIADSIEIARAVTDKTCVRVTEATGNPVIGLSYSDGVFEQPPQVEIQPTEPPV
jgi:hypothetical protein